MTAPNWRILVPVELAPGATLYMDDMTSLEFEEWSERIAAATEMADVRQILAETVSGRGWLDLARTQQAFASPEHAAESLSFKQLDLACREAAAESVQAAIAARFRDAAGAPAGVEDVPDGTRVRDLPQPAGEPVGG
jgi:hypothetical protein